MPPNGIPENVKAALERREPSLATLAEEAARVGVSPTTDITPAMLAEIDAMAYRAQTAEFQDFIMRVLFGIHSEILMMNYLEVQSRIGKIPKGLSRADRRRHIVGSAAKDVLFDEDRKYLKARIDRFARIFNSGSGLPPLAADPTTLATSSEISEENLTEEAKTEETPVQKHLSIKQALLIVLLVIAMFAASFYALLQTH